MLDVRRLSGRRCQSSITNGRGSDAGRARAPGISCPREPRAYRSGAACAVENLLETRSARPGGSLVGTRRPGAGSSDWGVSAQAVALFPGRDLRLDGLAGLAVALLNPADQLVALTLDLVEVVVRQLSPLFLDLALHLVPLAVQPRLIHRLLL